jgi:3-phenylpropionate/cinnamic acid dioxygenase small subunit
MQDLMLRAKLADPQGRYVATLDSDRIEEWAGLFVDDCPYAIASKENEDAGLPAPVIHCINIRMLRDRIVALPSANIYEKPQYRHDSTTMAASPPGRRRGLLADVRRRRGAYGSRRDQRPPGAADRP